MLFKFIKYAWAKENENYFFNPFRFMNNIINFIKHMSKEKNVPSKNLKAVAFIIALIFIVNMCTPNSKDSDTQTPKVTETQKSSEPVKVKKTAEELATEKIINDFVKLNEGLLGKMTSYIKYSDSNTFYYFETSNQPYIFTIKIVGGKVLNEFISIKRLDYSDSANINKDGTINEKSFNRAISVINKMIDDTNNTAKIQSQFDPWNGSNIYLVQSVKASMNDPHSFKHVNTSYYIDRKNSSIIHVVMKFRGKNSFGALVLNTIRAKMDVDGNILDYVFE